MQFLISVIDDLSGSGTAEEMVAIDAFNDKLEANGQLVFAGGLTDPKGAIVIDNRADANIQVDAPLFAAAENVSGFWIVRASDFEAARLLAFEGSKACNRKVELRAFFGN